MFGRNEITSKAAFSPGTLAVREIFYTLQGEGPLAGEAAVFIRLAGCNLQCWFCDTDFDMKRSRLMTPQEVEEEVSRLLPFKQSAENPRRVLFVVTGGEPMLQFLLPLMRALESFSVPHAPVAVQIETAGTTWCESLDPLFAFPPAFAPSFSLSSAPQFMLVCSPKTPNVHAEVARRCMHWKYIIDDSMPHDKSTGLPLFSENFRRPVYVPPKGSWVPSQIWVQPAFRYRGGIGSPDHARNAANIDRCVDLCKRFGYRLSLQQHKVARIP